jgi:hypothetical protein
MLLGGLGVSELIISGARGSGDAFQDLDLQLGQPGEYQWRRAQADVADEVARVRC